MPTYPGQTPLLNVAVLLKQPQLISRDLVSLTFKRFVADRVLVQGTPEQVAGGAARYQRDESIFVDRDPEKAAPRGSWPRTSWSEAVRTAAVQENGLEVVVNYLAIRRNNKPQLTIAERKLANNIVRFVDKQLFTLLEGDADVGTGAASAHWSVAGTDIIGDIAAAQEDIETQDNGYAGFDGATLLLPLAGRKWLLENTGLRGALPRESQAGQIQTGMMAPILGLKEILFSKQITGTKAILIDSTTAGFVADERPDPEEGFVAYDPGDGHPPIWTKVYDENGSRDKVIAGGRWPAMALQAPKAVRVITAVA